MSTSVVVLTVWSKFMGLKIGMAKCNTVDLKESMGWSKVMDLKATMAWSKVVDLKASKLVKT